MENNQEFDLEDILREFGDHSQEEPEATPPAEAPGEDHELPEKMPELQIEPEASLEAEETPAEPEPADDDTRDFSPLAEESGDTSAQEDGIPEPPLL